MTLKGHPDEVMTARETLLYLAMFGVLAASAARSFVREERDQ
jgi:hypothetical protein